MNLRAQAFVAAVVISGVIGWLLWSRPSTAENDCKIILKEDAEGRRDYLKSRYGGIDPKNSGAHMLVLCRDLYG